MMIVDAQVHIWAAHTPERPWPADGHARTHRDIPLGAEELCREMDAAGVDRAVLVPPSWEGDYNDLALQAAADHPGRFAVMGRLDLGDPSNAARLPDWRSQPGMLGIRASFLMPAQRQWLAEQSIDWFWEGAEAAGVPLMILPPDQLPAIDRVVRKYPDLRVIVDHLAMTSSRRDAEAFAAVDPESYRARLRRLRPGADVLGNGFVAASLRLSPGDHPLHRGAALPLRERQGTDHGAGHLRLARLVRLTRQSCPPRRSLYPLLQPNGIHRGKRRAI